MKDIKRKKKSKIKSEKLFPRRSTQIHEFIRIIRFFEGGIRVAKIGFYLDWVWGNIFCRLFSWCLFFLDQGESYTGKKLAETQSVKIQLKSREIPVDKNVGKMKQNLDTRRLTPKSAKLTCYSILKIQWRQNTGKDLKISKTGMADRWALLQVTKIYRPSGMWESLISGSLDMGLHSSNISEVWNFRTSIM